MGVSRKPQSPGSLEYLCLPAGGQVHLVPLAQVKGQGKAGDGDTKSSPGAQRSPSLESGMGPAPPEPGLMGVGQDQKDRATTVLPTGWPEDGTVASGYAVRGTLKSLLQHRSSKASILWCSAFFLQRKILKKLCRYSSIFTKGQRSLVGCSPWGH